MADSTVKVNFIGDSSRLKSAVDAAEGHLGRLAAGIGDIAKKAAIGFAAVGAGAAVFAKSAISAASDLAESQGKVNVVFKDQAEEITKWAATASKAFGQSKQSALEAVGTYGNLFSAFGIGAKQSATMSKSLVELAADLASFNNTSVDDALLALRSGLSGEAEPLKKYGIALTDARLKTEALALGLIKSTKDALTPAAKAQASYSLIMKDSALAQGDFARTSDGLANKTRILKAQFSDIQAEIGTRLLPIVTELAGFFLDKLLPAFSYVSTEIAGGVAAFVGAFRAGDDDITSSGFPGFLEKLGNVARDVFDWMRVNVPPVLEAIGNFITTQVVPALESMWHWVQNQLLPAIGRMVDAFKKDLWPTLEEDVIPAMVKLGNWIKENLIPMIGAIALIIIDTVIPAFFKLIKFIDEEVVPAIMAIVGPIAKIVEIVDKLTSMLFGHGKNAWEETLIAAGLIPNPTTVVVAGERLSTDDPTTVIKGEKIGKRAMGGPVSKWKPYLVGENGPEVFVPDSSGRIDRNGGAQAIQINIDGRSFMTWMVDYANAAGGVPMRIRR